MTLADLEQIALQANPSIGRVAALVEAARGNWVQVGLPPNPSFGYLGQQLGSGGRAEQHALLLEQEFVLGHKRESILKHHEPHSPGYARLKRRFDAPSLQWHLYDFLEQHGVAIPAELRRRPHTEPHVPHAGIQAGVLAIYDRQPDVRLLLESLTDVDEGLQEWRYRHVKMVERTIGHKPGTGGSPGVDYLLQTVTRPVFPDLWAIRTDL